MERDFKIGTNEFRLSKIDALSQFHIVRRLGPILGDLLSVVKKFKTDKEMSQEAQMDQIADLVKPIMAGLAKLSDEDSNRVLFGLLSAVEWKQPPALNYAKIVRDGHMMIETLDLSILMQAAGRAFMYNLSGFFAIAPQASHGGQ